MWKQRWGSGEEKCLDIKDEEDLHSEEEEEDVMDIEIKEEVRMGIQCNVLWNKGWNRLGDLYVCVSVIRHILTVFRNVIYLCLIHMYSLCKTAVLGMKCVTGIFLLGEGGVGVGNPNNKVGLQVTCCVYSVWLAVLLHCCNGLNTVMDWKVHREKLELNDTQKLLLYRDCDLMDKT